MKEGIHPQYEVVTVQCACGNTFQTRSTTAGDVYKVEICAACHPFFTGQQQRLIDIEGQVDRFYKKLQARQDYVETQKAKEDSKTSPERPIAELELGTRATEALAKAGIANVGDLLLKLNEGEAALLEVEGFGRKSMIDLKKKLRQFGYTLPKAAEEVAV